MSKDPLAFHSARGEGVQLNSMNKNGLIRRVRIVVLILALIAALVVYYYHVENAVHV